MEKVGKRTLYGKQPARVVLVDQSVPFDVSVAQDVCLVMENLMTVACNFNGPSRIPFFSIVLLQEDTEVLLPYSYVKNNFPRIQAAITEMRHILSDQTHGYSSCYNQGLQEAVSHYQKQLQSSFQSGGICQQLEVVIITCQQQSLVQKQGEAAVATVDIDTIKRVQVVCLHTGISMEETGNSQSSAGSSNIDHSSPISHISATGLVDVIIVEPDLMCLQNFFNHWLLDSNADCEHLHIILPPTPNTDHNLILKCDLQERLIHPAQLPFYSQFTLHADSSQMKMVFPCTSKALGVQLPVYKLHVTSLISRTAICDSLIFGMPLLVIPTACWRIEWDDLERNQQHIRALCQSLITKDEVMICQRLPPEDDQSYRSGLASQQQPCSYFVLLPSENGSMLLKSLAVQELMLPSAEPSRSDTITEDCLTAVQGSLEQVEKSEGYNPVLTPTQLYECLKNKHKKANTQRAQKRPQNTTSTSNRMVSSKARKSQKQRQQLEMCAMDNESDCLFQTPLTKRLESYTTSGHTKRSLYSGGCDRFLGEDEEDMETWQQPHTFPTSL